MSASSGRVHVTPGLLTFCLLAVLSGGVVVGYYSQSLNSQLSSPACSAPGTAGAACGSSCTKWTTSGPTPGTQTCATGLSCTNGTCTTSPTPTSATPTGGTMGGGTPTGTTAGTTPTTPPPPTFPPDYTDAMKNGMCLGYKNNCERSGWMSSDCNLYNNMGCAAITGQDVPCSDRYKKSGTMCIPDPATYCPPGYTYKDSNLNDTTPGYCSNDAQQGCQEAGGTWSCPVGVPSCTDGTCACPSGKVFDAATKTCKCPDGTFWFVPPSFGGVTAPPRCATSCPFFDPNIPPDRTKSAFNCECPDGHDKVIDQRPGATRGGGTCYPK